MLDAQNVSVMLETAASYLLVAILPGEIQEAGGEKLIFGPGIAVHGVRQPRRVEESAEFVRLKTELLSFMSVFPRRVSLFLCAWSSVSPSPGFLLLLFFSVLCCGRCQTISGGALAAAAPVTWAPSPKKQSGMLWRVMVPNVGSADRLEVSWVSEWTKNAFVPL
ncbi:hypothetical protein EXN66_Car013666 [Channa argus]|uniref:Uncharacterized protein n=1 Tax=Channa argus TaxID=215402 RepID=A0A6G1Q611_CHAAH|nr:hypothetical protein EXN66_Car013666 [Channa argus]